jgi:parallel beta-helix repeat protein
VIVLLICVLTVTVQAAPLGTAITYQGRLSDNASLATGDFEIRFIVYNASFGGNQAGPALTNVVAVTNGLFQTTLDFGGIFDGTAYWLELAVRPFGSLLTDFTTLSPRQALTPTPYALFAPAAGTAVSAETAAIANNVSGIVAEAQIDPLLARDSEIVPAVLANDGSGSTLDADTLDGLDSTEFLASAGGAGRIPITYLPFTINQPGSYYVTANLTGVPGTNGITVNASHVTIDLNGFDMVGVPGAQSGINVVGFRTNVAIYNGTLRSWPGGAVFAIFVRAMHLNRLRASDNTIGGLVSGPHSLIVDCHATRNQVMPNGAGIAAGIHSIVKNCIANENIGDGISASDGSTVTGCTANHNVTDGIQVTTDCRVIGNTCAGNGNGGDGAAIHASISNRIEGNTALNSDRGLDIDGNVNYVANNIVRANSDNYDIAQGNQLNLLLSQVPENIDWPAHVTLAGTITGTSQSTNGITIKADNVTIDLGGHALIGVPGSLNGIATFGVRTNITVRNGIVRNWGGRGISVGLSVNCQFAGLRVSGNASDGIAAGEDSTLSDCSAFANGARGIVLDINSTARNCTVARNVGIGIEATSSTIVGCVARNNASSGFSIGNATITACTAIQNGGAGISVFESFIVNCTASQNDSDGIYASSRSSILNNTCTLNGLSGDGAGIHVDLAGNRIEGNHVTLNDRGIDVDSGENLIIRNSARGNTTAYAIAPGNSVGPILTPADIAGSSNPHANYDL